MSDNIYIKNGKNTILYVFQRYFKFVIIAKLYFMPYALVDYSFNTIYRNATILGCVLIYKQTNIQQYIVVTCVEVRYIVTNTFFVFDNTIES